MESSIEINEINWSLPFPVHFHNDSLRFHNSSLRFHNDSLHLAHDNVGNDVLLRICIFQLIFPESVTFGSLPLDIYFKRILVSE